MVGAMTKGPSKRALAVAVIGLSMLGGCMQTAGTEPPMTGAGQEKVRLKLTEAEYRKPVWRALEAIRDKEYEKANFILNEALNLEPAQADLHFLNAYVYELRGRIEGTETTDLAQAGYIAALNNDLRHWPSAYRLGLFHMRKGNYQEALRWLGDAALIKDDSPEIFEALAEASYMTFDAAAAEAFLNRAADLTGETAENIRARAVVNAALDDREDAEKFVDKYKSLVPEQKARRLAQRVQQWEGFHDSALRNAALRGGTAHVQQAQFFGGKTPSGVPSSKAPSTSAPAASSDSEEKPEELKKLPGMLVIDAIIIRQATAVEEKRGVNLLSQLQTNFSGSVFQYTRDGATTGGTSTNRFQNALTIALGTASTTSITYNLNIANNTDSRTEILARPSITVLEGETGSFFLGQEVTYSVDGDGSDSFDKEVGITFEVTPEILDGGRVRLEAKAEFDTFTTSTSSVTYARVIPTLKNRLSSTAILTVGQTLVLGGGTQEEKSKTSDDVPVLGRVPLLQYLFSSKVSTNKDTSLVFLITPRLAETVDDPDSVNAAAGEQGIKTESDVMRQLRQRFRNWFDPTSNLTKALIGLSYSDLYREFRVGDLKFSDGDNDGDFDHLLAKDGDGFLNTYEDGFFPELLRYFYFD
jgi:tetratricopeptide (TPR) repeat protein